MNVRSTAFFGLRRRSNLKSVFCLLLVLTAWGWPRCAKAQASQWDSLISNTHWYVPEPYLVAYAAVNSNNFLIPSPILAGDQTLWSIGEVKNGSFTGISTATLSLPASTSENRPSASIDGVTTMSGAVLPSGSIRITFTDPSNGTTTLGVGQMQFLDGTPLMEMQMITGTGLLLTHWAYMAPYDPATLTPPAASAVTTAANTAPQWAWTPGTRWRITSPALFGSNAPGSFLITHYGNGFFLGAGVGPAGSATGYFTQLGSITPEGSVLFDTITAGTLNSFLGQITGDPFGATISVSGYGFSGDDYGNTALLTLVAPYANALAANANPAAVGAAQSLYSLAGSEAGLLGPLAPVLTVLDNLDGPTLSHALSQTLPVLNGAGSQATANTLRNFSQLIQARQEERQGLASGEDIVGTRNMWGVAFGRWSSQGAVKDVAGYNTNSYGVAAGFDWDLSPKSTLGLAFTFCDSLIKSRDSAAPSRLNVTSYQLGAYGGLAFAEHFTWNYQAGFGIHTNKGSRDISFYNANAASDYFSYSWHAGTGLQRDFAVTDKTVFIPLIRLDYLEVLSPAYEESGAGVLDLHVHDQTYREFFSSVDFRVDHALSPAVKLFAKAGVGYNLLKDDVRITASFAGGGDAFDTHGLEPSPWLYHAGLGLSGMLRQDIELAAGYDMQASPTSYLNQSASVKLKISF
uniref:Outer membrane autotransporter barrel domain-containing protein n=1 Tax=Desulfovibrio sp. U5L TaxID=596152 RepID=I2Q6E8_9BACT